MPPLARPEVLLRGTGSLRPEAQYDLEALIYAIHEVARKVADRAKDERLVDGHEILALDHRRNPQTRLPPFGSGNVDW